MLNRVGPPAALLALCVLAWQGLAALPAIDDLLLASPLEVVGAARRDAALLADNALVTLVEVVLGLALAVGVGVGAAVAMHLVRPVREAASPLLVASQAIPVPILAPLFVLAFDYGLAPKIAITALIAFFPIAVGVLFGLRSVDPDAVKLVRSLGGSRSTILRKVEAPAALPAFFSALRIGATVSVIGAVFGEWAGADEGLGRLVLLANNQLQTPRVYAGVVGLSLMAVALFALVALAERLVVPWHRAEARA
jgi:ABC-type nitrate/sulfonate/bicarbonate transport system permease component